MITTRIPGQPEQYVGKYRTSHTTVAYSATCPGCGEDCTWTSTPTGSAPVCDCPTDTGTGVRGEATPVPGQT